MFMKKNKTPYDNAEKCDNSKSKKNHVLLTGANGFLGTQIARQLISIPGLSITAMVRAQEEGLALLRLKRTWYQWDRLLGALNNRIKVIAGDITREDLGLARKDHYHELSSKITHIIHTAADLRLHAPLEELFDTNLNGTCNLLKLAEKANEKGIFKRFSYLSTAYVAGKKEGFILEEGSIYKNKDKSNHTFWSHYEKSKDEAEWAVRQSDIPFTIFRPGMVIGDSRKGEIKNFNTIYTLLKLYMTRKLRFIPTRASLVLNIIPVNYVAQAICKITFHHQGEGKIFHLTAPHDALPSIGEFLEAARLWAGEHINTKLPRPIFIPLAPLVRGIATKIPQPKNRYLSVLFTLAPYLEERRYFKRDNTDLFLGHFNLDWREYLPHILEYAVYHGFFHCSERTVHEQILHRLQSRSYPVKYFNITSAGIKEKPPIELKRDIISAYHSLKGLGIFPGDRIAIIGSNSSRYLTLDIAIGLLGAVSVPIYYTSPVSEIRNIIADSKAKILFIGSHNLIERLHEADLEMPMISFCQKLDYIPSQIKSWSAFLKKGRDKIKTGHLNYSNLKPPVDFDSLATIRYTSGTTGKPKGVTFHHKHLRWMAESMASLPSWENRTHEVRYLSFLPMNHVVEGILGTYSPYYAPAPLRIYFLEDFSQLASALHKVKPSIFFSVPRFYEKLWCRFKANLLGKFYVTLKEGHLKQGLKPMIRGLLLHKTGLDRCSQLIVGSATSSRKLIQEYHDLGIEIHNAYGLTEAPLVTLNRKGNNRLGTVGEPLPKTWVKIGNDGEILVNGPQVTPGYFHAKRMPFTNDQWLKTGDIGFLTPAKSLVITGRKKELIINSYGKNIHPLNIEALLRDTLGICDAMLVGESRPYLVALLWVNEDYNPDEIAQKIRKINQDLSHPQQIKRWAIVAHDLSIDGGDLTANMKLKREIITQRYRDVIEALYQGTAHPLILKLGRIEA